MKNVIFATPAVGQGITATIELSSIIAMWVGASFVISFIWIGLLRCVTGAIVYISVILVPITVAAVGAGLWLYGENAFVFRDYDNSHRYTAGVCFGIAVIILFVVIFLWGKFKAAVAVIKIAARAFSANVTALAAPLLSILLLAIFWAITIASCVFNYTSAEFTIGLRESTKTPYLTYDLDKNLQYVLVFHLVYLVFISVHIYFTNYYAQSSAIVEWYFKPDKGSLCNCRCLYGFGLALTKSLGTIALSALIMTPIYLMILACEYLDRKSKEAGETIPCFVKFLITCMKCCLYCFEKFMRYLNKSLLTCSQIYNIGWWKSAKLTIDLLVSDVVMTAIMNGITSFIIFLSKVAVGALATVGFICYLKYIGDETAGWVFPAFIVFFLSYIVGAFILGLFTNTIDIVFVCYQADVDLAENEEEMYISQEMGDMVDDLKATAGDGKVEGEKIEAESLK
jgi:hypothetical protein